MWRFGPHRRGMGSAPRRVIVTVRRSEPIPAVRVLGRTILVGHQTLRTCASLLTGRQCDRLNSVFAGEEHAAINVTWGIDRRVLETYRNHDRAAAKQ